MLVAGSVADGAVLAGVYVARDLIVTGKTPSLAKAGTIGISQIAYNNLARMKLEAWLSGYTGETMYSGLLANTVGLASVLYVLGAIGIVSQKSAKSEGEGDVLPSPKGKTSGKKVMKALLEAGELVVERKIVEYGLGMAGISVFSGGPAMPAPVGSAGSSGY